jgi:hypothetical protein
MGATVTLRELLRIIAAKELSGALGLGDAVCVHVDSATATAAMTSTGTTSTKKDGTASSMVTNHGADLVLIEAMALPKVFIQKSPDALRCINRLGGRARRRNTACN